MNHRGFSLMECTLAVALLAILTTLSMPTSDGVWQRGQRAMARQALAQAQSWVERGQALTGSAVLALPDPGPWTDGLSYRLSLQTSGEGYVLRAIPQGRQNGDTCGVLWLADTGLRGADAAGCW